MPLLQANLAHPIVLADGTVIKNTVYLKNVISHPRIEVGDYSYCSNFDCPEDIASALAPYLFPFSRERLVIGRFVQIAHGAVFVTSAANHPMSGFSTYPFRIFRPETVADYGDLPFKDTIVGHDVWIGYKAIILPGVTIGSGAIVAAGAVVTRDVAPYTIVGGNPAVQIRRRFASDVIEALLAIAWWDWPLERIEASLEAIETGDLDALKAG
ncbi:CatB-related O-acetyltransferase [Rhizobiaceae bacterium n13]|uniref:CatB-related O-acetyltransferase n=1 Tax=Ferirhizobium litorale TaxID=2927786 RepID=A0AAE3Q7B3_9HYPH|nr:CatB-related O-acetyltransferase [Fererhizobium litorale]MDI7860437.1 CatB-related O-acetyltransferase [Fererhizobium litorale]MDI7920572.1 CatB-related O-acetyltransferase [Fererhizobium litorale]